MLVATAVVAGLAPALAAGTEAHAFTSAALGRPWNVSVLLPPDYAADARHYPVVYLLPGVSARRGEWTELALPMLAGGGMARGRLPQAIVVVPELGNSWGVDGPERMETALMHDLPAWVAARFRVLEGRGGRVLLGISAGGFAALRLALLRPHRFAAVGLLSPAIYDPAPPANSAARRAAAFGAEEFDSRRWRALNYPALLPRFLESGVMMPLHVAAGDADPLGIAWHAANLHRTWQEHGQPCELRIIAGAHSYEAWKALLGGALSFVLRHAAQAA